MWAMSVHVRCPEIYLSHVGTPGNMPAFD
uniref:Uncharacterized protein n=1 Tax=Arundo donax TaxID=35708 RepID=A0A0A9BXZ4_ARUDO